MLTDMKLEESLKGYFDLLNQGKSMDATFKGYGRMQMEEVQVQTWRDGQIVQEWFFYNRG